MQLHHIKLDVVEQIKADVRAARDAEKMLIVLDTDEVHLVSAVVYAADAATAPMIRRGKFMALADGDIMTMRHAENIHWQLPGEEKAKIDMEAPQVYVLYLPAEEEEKKLLMRRLREAMKYAERCRGVSETSFILYGDPADLAPDLARMAEVIAVPYPRLKDIRAIVDACMDAYGYPAPGSDKREEEMRRKLALQLRGFSCVDALSMMTRLLNAPDEKGEAVVRNEMLYRRVIQKVKAQVLRRSGSVLELIDEKTEEIGGMDAIKVWIRSNRPFMKEIDAIEAQIGHVSPMGLLLNGVPGCGKSDMARYLAAQWNLPLIRLDFGRLMNSLVGESERNLRKALSQLEAMESILWVDEIEKAIGGGNSGKETDGGTSQRMLATLLTWLQERERKRVRCFLYATANKMQGLPPELTRFGRVDEKFSVMLPTHESCRDIFKALMQRAEEDAQKARAELGITDETPYKLFETDCYNVLDSFISGHEAGCGESKKSISLAWPEDCRVDEAAETDAQPDDRARKHAPMFVSGTDILKIVQAARKLCAVDPNGSCPISAVQWIGALRRVINPAAAGDAAQEHVRLSVTSTGDDSMEDVAISYIRMLRGSFIPAEGTQRTLFAPEDYNNHITRDREKGTVTIDLGKRKVFDWSYDQLLYNDLRERIERLGSVYEQNAEYHRAQP